MDGDVVKQGVLRERRAGRPSKLDADLLDQVVVDTALRLFLRDGFSRTTVEHIATTCGTVRRTVLHRFPTKEELFLAAARRHHEIWVAKEADLPKSDDPLIALRDWCGFLLYSALHADNAAMFRMCAGEAAHILGLADLILNWDSAVTRSTEDLVLQAQKSGLFQRQDAETLACEIHSMMMSYPLNRSMFFDPVFSDQRSVDIYSSRVWSLFVRMA